jgi:tRNA A-37 threonylcarbamoyl transferase component Bud32
MTESSKLATALADRYRLERPLGQGGMATVYLAADLKHDRQVAIKVLKPELAAVLGAERFVQEIKTTAQLQHPHILPLFDSGSADGFLYYVMPYIEGETLRDKLNREKQLGIEEAIKITMEVADALDYAHRHGVIHRDIKPENILLHDGRPMVADFGIALAVSAAAGGRMTETGLSLGTPHYMSPEQAAAEKEITARSDVYSLASVLYEMLTGNPPHTGTSAQQIIMKIITEPVAAVTSLRKSVPPNVAAALSKALEKLPADRFESARAFADALANPGFRTATSPAAALPAALPAYRLTALFALGFVLALAAAAWGWLRPARSAAVTFTQQTFRPEAIYRARFAPDGRTILLGSMGKEGTVPHLYVIRPESPEPEAIGPDSTDLLSVSSTGELAVLTSARYSYHREFIGTLATLPPGGGSPRLLMENVREADWSPDGRAMAIIRTAGAVDRLEYPVGIVRRQAPGYLSDVRVSPRGDLIGFLEHPASEDDRGEAVLIDTTGREVARSPTYWAVEGLAWQPDGRSILFSGAAEAGSWMTMTVQAMTRSGEVHQVLGSSGGLTVQDVADGGRWLVTRDEITLEVHTISSAGVERNLSWLDVSFFPVIGPDPAVVAFADGGTTGGLTYETLLRKTDGSSPVRLGPGEPLAFSRDGHWLLVTELSTPPRVWLYPTGPGAARRLDQGQFRSIQYTCGTLFDDGARFFVCGALKGQSQRCFIGAIDGQSLTPVTPEGTIQAAASTDGRQIVAQVGDSFRLYPVDGGSPRPARGLDPRDRLIRWSPDGREIWVYRQGTTAPVDQVDPATGHRTRLTEIATKDGVGLRFTGYVAVSDDRSRFAFQLRRHLSALFVVQGAR